MERSLLTLLLKQCNFHLFQSEYIVRTVTSTPPFNLSPTYYLSCKFRGLIGSLNRGAHVPFASSF